MRRFAAMLAVAALWSGGCGRDDEPREPVPAGPLAATLGELGGGGEHASLGVSWADPRLLARNGLSAELLADVLAPNADTVAEGAAALRRRYGLDPLAAKRLVAVGGSYAFGLRLDGVDGAGLARALVAAGGRSYDHNGTELIEIGAYAEVPDPLLAVDVNGLGAYDAFGPGFAVLAISDRARSALLGRGPRLLDEPAYAAAADCLGPEVVAARLVPDKQLLSIETGIDMVALGVTPESEVVCALGGSSERAAAVATALTAAFAPRAHDPVTGARLGRLARSVDVERDDLGGVATVRAEAVRAPEAEAGFMLATISTGSLVSMLNGDTKSFLP